MDEASRQRDIARVHDAHQALTEHLVVMTDGAGADAALPSLLPGWTRGHVLTHIARNADSFVRLLEAAGRGEVVTQYARGVEGRNADIEAGATREWATLVDDVELVGREARGCLRRSVPLGPGDDELARRIGAPCRPSVPPPPGSPRPPCRSRRRRVHAGGVASRLRARGTAPDGDAVQRPPTNGSLRTSRGGHCRRSASSGCAGCSGVAPSRAWSQPPSSSGHSACLVAVRTLASGILPMNRRPPRTGRQGAPRWRTRRWVPWRSRSSASPLSPMAVARN